MAACYQADKLSQYNSIVDNPTFAHYLATGKQTILSLIDDLGLGLEDVYQVTANYPDLAEKIMTRLSEEINAPVSPVRALEN